MELHYNISTCLNALILHVKLQLQAWCSKLSSQARSSMCSLSISYNNWQLSCQTIYREWLTKSCPIKFTYMEGKKHIDGSTEKKKRKTGKTWSSTSTMLSSHARRETGRYSRTLLSSWRLRYFGLSRKTLGGSVIAHWHRYKATGKLRADLRPVPVSQHGLANPSYTDRRTTSLQRPVNRGLLCHYAITVWKTTAPTEIFRDAHVIRFNCKQATPLSALLIRLHYMWAGEQCLGLVWHVGGKTPVRIEG